MAQCFADVGILDYERGQLKTGDFFFLLRRAGEPDRVLPVVLERKTWSDLHASIYDDERFVSQTRKMVRCGLPLKVFLVEGDHVASQTTELGKRIPELTARLDELACLRGFHVVLTRNHHKTVIILGQIARLLHAMTSDGRIDEASCPTFDDFCSNWMAGEPDAAPAAAAPPAGGQG